MLKFYLFIKFASQTNSGSFLCSFVSKLLYFHWVWAITLRNRRSEFKYEFSKLRDLGQVTHSRCLSPYLAPEEKTMPTLWEKVRVKWGSICEMTAPCLRLYMLFAVFPPVSKLLPMLSLQSRIPLLLSSFHLDNSYLF